MLPNYTDERAKVHLNDPEMWPIIPTSKSESMISRSSDANATTLTVIILKQNIVYETEQNMDNININQQWAWKMIVYNDRSGI